MSAQIATMLQKTNSPFWAMYNQGFALVDYPSALKRKVFSLAQQAENFFSGVRMGQKKRFILPCESNWNSGYIHRTSEDGFDEKEYLHVQPNFSQVLKDHNRYDDAMEIMDAGRLFLTAEKLLNEDLREFMLDSADLISEDNSYLDNLSDQIKKAYDENYVVLRFLHYTPHKVRDVLAAPHFDVGGITTQIYESKPGMQFLTPTGEWIDAPMQPGLAAMFPSWGMQCMTDQHCIDSQKEKILQNTIHRVVPKDGLTERYSAVLFIDFPDYPNWDSDAWGPTRDQPMRYMPRQLI